MEERNKTKRELRDWIAAVDADEAARLRTEAILTEAGMEVTAFSSDAELTDAIREGKQPDLILLDVCLPGEAGLQALRRLTGPEGMGIPLIILTDEGHQDMESRGFQCGAVDFVRKPYEAEVLISRIQNALSVHKRMQQLEQDAVTDSLTGLYNRPAIDIKLARLVRSRRGMLCLLDLDHFKSINDLFGHAMGDQIIVTFSAILKKRIAPDGVCGRIGGDEFLLFTEKLRSERELNDFCTALNEAYLKEAVALLGPQLQIPVGISIGAVLVPEYGTDLAHLSHLADQATYYVKENGRHGCRLYSRSVGERGVPQTDMDLETVTAILEERNVSPNAMWMGREMFGSIYRYLVRYMDRYHNTAYRVLLTLHTDEDVSGEELSEIMSEFNEMLRSALRNSDVMMECGDHQVFLLLPEIREYDIERVLKRLLSNWKLSPNYKRTKIRYECGPVHPNNNINVSDEERESHVVVVDDDEVNRLIVEKILKRQGLRITTLPSGQALLKLALKDRPDLVLLDVMMPEMDGFETMRQLRKLDPEHAIPVIYLTADDNRETEARCLNSGAVDFIRKPFAAEALILRVRHTLQLNGLQKNLSAAVERKTRENRALSLRLVYTLAEAIDAKDNYTNGHSSRVAGYAREISKRYGYGRMQQDEVYMMGLLHDVGKIGVPDSIINKPGRLTDEEYEKIKQHPVMGGKILQGIEEMPSLEDAARWHHERYDGKGYPDGLAGEDIPEAARIIAVADAYDAMSSRRSYRDVLPQAVVRKELLEGRGTQFDPKFADIMLEMIDEDREYHNREQ